MIRNDPDYLFESENIRNARISKEKSRLNYNKGEPIRMPSKVISSSPILSVSLPAANLTVSSEHGPALDLIFTGDSSGFIYGIDVNHRKILYQSSCHRGPVSALNFITNHNESKNNLLGYLCSGSWDKSLNIYQITCTYTETFSIQLELLAKIQDAHLDYVKVIRPLQRENLFLTASTDKTVKLWTFSVDPHNPKNACFSCVHQWTHHKRGLLDLAIVHEDAQNSVYVSASSDTEILAVDMTTGAIVASFQQHYTSVNCLYISDDIFLSGSADKRLISWKWDSQSTSHVPFKNEIEHEWIVDDVIRCIAVSLIYQRIFIGTRDGHLVILHLQDEHAESLKIDCHFDEISTLTTYKDHYIISTGLDSTIRFWNISDLLSDHKETEKEVPSACNISLSIDEENELNALLESDI